MDDPKVPVAPPTVARGRPKKNKKPEELAKLHNFPGTKMEQLQRLYDDWYNCKRCYLSSFREGEDIVFGDGNPDADIMIVGEAPGEEEDKTGIPFVGASGKLLNQMLAKISDDLDIQELSKWYKKVSHTQANSDKFHETVLQWRQKEFFTTNVVACRPPENRSPTPPEVKACWERLYNLIYIVDPKLIIAAGRSSVEALVRGKFEITKHRGELFDVSIPGRVSKVIYPVMAVFHPSYLLRKADWKDPSGDYAKTIKDLYRAMRYVDGIRARHYGTDIPMRMEP